MLKRVALFLLTNAMVILTLSIITTVFGLHHYLTAHGIDYQSLAVFCVIWGMGGAFISLLISKWVAKTMMGVKVIEPHTAMNQEKALLDMVYALARKAGLLVMPEVGVYNSPELNAFATGPTKKNALVAVSTGLLDNMDHAEVEGVLGHEVSHIANGDMVTMTLIQGTVNAFALFLSRIIAYAVSMVMSRGESEDNAHPGSMLYFVLTIVFDVIFTLLGSLVVAAFSRYREYRADRGSARLAGKNKMIAALKRLQKATAVDEDERAPSLAALKIVHKNSWLALFSTHPPLEMRIARLEDETRY
ncbi:TPA: protease HtpX [Legionella pneumophila]